MRVLDITEEQSHKRFVVSCIVHLGNIQRPRELRLVDGLAATAYLPSIAQPRTNKTWEGDRF